MIRFILKSWMVALEMVNKGLDTYTVYAFESQRDLEVGNWFFKDEFKSHEAALDWLAEFEVLHPELKYTTDFESLV